MLKATISGGSGKLTTVKAKPSLQAVTEKRTVVEAEKYEGPYEVVPDVDSQELATKDRLMTDNMVIQKIPYYEVSNTSGGKTIYIRRDTE